MKPREYVAYLLSPTGKALNQGKLKYQPCSKCGWKHSVHMHHPDYSRPLYVIWLCWRCHAAEHKAERVSRATI